MLATRDIYIDYVVRNFRENILSKLESLDTLHKKKKFIKKLRNPRHVNYLSEFSSISFTDFKTILKHMNKAVSKDIVEGSSLKMGHKLGYIYIKEPDRKFKLSDNGKFNTKKNWGASQKKKQGLIDQGKVPLQYYKDEEGKIIGDNGGEEWIVYYTDATFFRFSWWKMRVKEAFSNKFFNPLRNISTYSFVPTKDNRLLLSRVRNVREENLELLEDDL